LSPIRPLLSADNVPLCTHPEVTALDVTEGAERGLPFVICGRNFRAGNDAGSGHPPAGGDRAEGEEIGGYSQDHHGMAAAAALAHDSRHIAGDCRPNRACDEPQEAAESSARPGHRAKPRATSPTAPAAGSSRLPATKESALTLISSG
jgi:hypothetical protein